jgi:thiol:disulfide interchange protein
MVLFRINSFLLSLLLWLGLQQLAFAQHGPKTLATTPEWSITVEPKVVKPGDIVTVTLTSIIEPDWYMYSNDFDPIGPTVAEFTWEKNDGYTLIGSPKAIGSKKHYEEIWKGTVSIFTKKAIFMQQIKINKVNPIIKGSIYFQECNEVSGICMPPYDVPFEIKVRVEENKKPNSANTSVSVDTTTETIVSKDTGTVVTVKSDSTITNSSNVNTKSGKKEETLLAFLLVAFLGGLVAVATPCVFPMLPMTVSFFTKKSQTRLQGIIRAFTFGFSIIAIYASLGFVFALFGLGPDFGNWLSTHWLPNILFFIIFMVFAASFLGLFEITLPHGFVNKIDSKSSMSSFAGLFFMAFTLVVVSFSCTGPIVGSLLIEAVGGKFLKPLIGMGAFGLGLALPFTIFAVFPSYLQNLPKSGGWLNSVKVVLGFVEIAFAFKFLSTADVVYHWGLLDREIYLTIWIILSFLLGMYLLGKLKFSHDSDLPYISVPRFFLALTAFVFGLYMIPGLFGAPLKALSGLLPPLYTQDFVVVNASKENIGKNKKHSNLLHVPHGIDGYFDYKEALEESKKQNKPVFVDFTGHACVNCRKMEEFVWAKPEVLKRLKEDFIVVSLYADERKVLPENEWYISSRDGKVKKTIGEQNQDLQITKYGYSAQPQYIIIDANENQLSGPTFFDTDEQKFINFLEEGKKTYQNKQ